MRKRNVRMKNIFTIWAMKLSEVTERGFWLMRVEKFWGQNQWNERLWLSVHCLAGQTLLTLIGGLSSISLSGRPPANVPLVFTTHPHPSGPVLTPVPPSPPSPLSSPLVKWLLIHFLHWTRQMDWPGFVVIVQIILSKYWSGIWQKVFVQQ